jgi:hypothetical protein
MKIVMIDERDIKEEKTVGYINMYIVAEFFVSCFEKGRSHSG